jgi:hypothetical protein
MKYLDIDSKGKGRWAPDWERAEELWKARGLC